MQVPLCLFYESSWHLGSVFWGNYAAVLWCFRVLQLWGGPSTVFGAAVMTEKQLLVLFSMFRSMSAVVLVRTTVVCVGSFPGAVLGWKRQIIIRFKSHSLLMVENHSMQTVSEINSADQLLHIREKFRAFFWFCSRFVWIFCYYCFNFNLLCCFNCV